MIARLLAAGAILVAFSSCNSAEVAGPVAEDVVIDDYQFSKGGLDGRSMIEICRYRPQRNSYRKIRVTRIKARQLLARGGGFPNGPVPGMDGFIFNDSCVPEQTACTAEAVSLCHEIEAAMDSLDVQRTEYTTTSWCTNRQVACEISEATLTLATPDPYVARWYRLMRCVDGEMWCTRTLENPVQSSHPRESATIQCDGLSSRSAGSIDGVGPGYHIGFSDIICRDDGMRHIIWYTGG